MQTKTKTAAASKKPATKVYRFHTDPAHGWLAVKRTEIERLGLADKITAYSYQRGGTVYLEEDCDLTTFAKRKAELGEEWSAKNSHTDNCSPVRSYDGYSA